MDSIHIVIDAPENRLVLLIEKFYANLKFEFQLYGNGSLFPENRNKNAIGQVTTKL